MNLTETNPTRVGLPSPEPGLLAHPGALDYEPEPQGLLSAREAVAAHLTTRGARVSSEHLFLSASTSESYGWLFKLLCEPGDNVLVPAPSYPLFEYLTRLEGVETRPYRLPRAHGFGLDVEAVAAAKNERTRAVLVVNPATPPGTTCTRASWRRWARCASGRGWRSSRTRCSPTSPGTRSRAGWPRWPGAHCPC